jgi:hypothetical protein
MILHGFDAVRGAWTGTARLGGSIFRKSWPFWPFQMKSTLSAPPAVMRVPSTEAATL